MSLSIASDTSGPDKLSSFALSWSIENNSPLEERLAKLVELKEFRDEFTEFCFIGKPKWLSLISLYSWLYVMDDTDDPQREELTDDTLDRGAVFLLVKV